MAGIVVKALKVAAGVAAGIAAGAGVYRAGKRAGADRAQAGAQNTSGSLAQSAVKSPFEDMPRPGMKASPEQAPQIASDRRAYHSLINARANDLRARIAEQAYASVLQGESDAGDQVQAEAVEVKENAQAVQEEKPGDLEETTGQDQVADQATGQDKAAVQEKAPAAHNEESPAQDAKSQASSEPAAQTVDPSTDYEDDPEPYERIQDALKTTKLFDEEGEDVYKPTPFRMPGD